MRQINNTFTQKPKTYLILKSFDDVILMFNFHFHIILLKAMPEKEKEIDYVEEKIQYLLKFIGIKRFIWFYR